MKKYFGLFVITILCLSILSLTGCRLFNRGSDDPAIPQTKVIPFKVAGKVNLSVKPSIRAKVGLGDDLKAQVYTMQTDGKLTQVPGTGDFDVDSNDGSYECAFNSEAAYFIIKIISKKYPKFELLLVLGDLDENTNVVKNQEIDSHTTAKGLYITGLGKQMDPLTVTDADLKVFIKAVNEALESGEGEVELHTKVEVSRIDDGTNSMMIAIEGIGKTADIKTTSGLSIGGKPVEFVYSPALSEKTLIMSLKDSQSYTGKTIDPFTSVGFSMPLPAGTKIIFIRTDEEQDPIEIVL